MKGLYPKIMLLVGGAFLLTVTAILVFIYITESMEIEQVGLAQAKTHNQVAFEALYASMSQGGSREGNLQVIERLRETGIFTSLRVIKGEPVVRQFGATPDELPKDDLERRALAGEAVQEIRNEDGYRVVRYVKPLFVEEKCQRCHQAEIGAVNGAISTEISLQAYDDVLRQRLKALLRVIGGSLLALAMLVFYAVQRLVIRPLQTIRQGAAAIAQGDLSHRLDVSTNDELESLASEFNRMAQQLEESYGQVAEEKSKVLAAIESSRDAIWISDANQRIVMVNSALEHLTGRSREELVGQSCRYLFDVRTMDGALTCDTLCPFLHPDEDDAHYADWGGIEGCMPTASGKDAWIEISYGRVRNPENNKLSGVVHIVHDLTQRKKIEELKDEFLSLVSHELRTPLHHIKGFATTLLQTDVEWDSATQRDFLESINSEADRLATLVKKILHLSRLEAGTLPMEKELYSVDELVNGVLSRQRNIAAYRRVEAHLAPDLPPVWMDRREIECVLTNLIENAHKYADPGTPITLEVECRDGQVVFCVSDQGPGISPEQLERIFDRFYRIKGQNHHAAGTGLGLAICKRIVEAHGGRIWVESTPGVGSSFYFSLEVVEQPVMVEG